MRCTKVSAQSDKAGFRVDPRQFDFIQRRLSGCYLRVEQRFRAAFKAGYECGFSR
jgi:hypothetical protein